MIGILFTHEDDEATIALQSERKRGYTADCMLREWRQQAEKALDRIDGPPRDMVRLLVTGHAIITYQHHPYNLRQQHSTQPSSASFTTFNTHRKAPHPDYRQTDAWLLGSVSLGMSRQAAPTPPIRNPNHHCWCIYAQPIMVREPFISISRDWDPTRPSPVWPTAANRCSNNATRSTADPLTALQVPILPIPDGDSPEATSWSKCKCCTTSSIVRPMQLLRTALAFHRPIREQCFRPLSGNHHDITTPLFASQQIEMQIGAWRFTDDVIRHLQPVSAPALPSICTRTCADSCISSESMGGRGNFFNLMEVLPRQ
ncbi:hypothetical protein BASA61_004320 [Batrachochytrium salamandrivorans]|nr:hypothetical protein BASA61_004320 [Batrachochytrium salamandrivorans]